MRHALKQNESAEAHWFVALVEPGDGKVFETA